MNRIMLATLALCTFAFPTTAATSNKSPQVTSYVREGIVWCEIKERDGRWACDRDELRRFGYEPDANDLPIRKRIATPKSSAQQPAQPAE
jgi:hypothetical protein